MIQTQKQKGVTSRLSVGGLVPHRRGKEAKQNEEHKELIPSSSLLSDAPFKPPQSNEILEAKNSGLIHINGTIHVPFIILITSLLKEELAHISANSQIN